MVACIITMWVWKGVEALHTGLAPPLTPKSKAGLSEVDCAF